MERWVISRFLDEVGIVVRSALGENFSIDMQAVAFQFVDKVMIHVVILSVLCTCWQVASMYLLVHGVMEREWQVKIAITGIHVCQIIHRRDGAFIIDVCQRSFKGADALYPCFFKTVICASDYPFL